MFSRLVALMAVAALAAAAVAAAVRPGPMIMTHPRNWVVAVVCCLLGIRVVAHTRRNTVGWVLVAMGVCGALAVGGGSWAGMRWSAWVATWIWWPSYALLPVILLVFPTGRLVSSRWRVVLGLSMIGVVLPTVGMGWASWLSPATFWADAVRGTASRGLPVYLALAGFISFTVSLLGALVALILRYRRDTGSQRRLLLWSVGWTALLIPGWLLETFEAAWGTWALAAAAVPVAALIAILRYGLYDIDLVIHRSLLYGFLTVILIAVYAAIVLLAATLFPSQAHIIGTVIVVLAVAPVYRALRGRLDRWLYGARADPYHALSQLGECLANPLRPHDVLPTVARSVGEALKLPYVAVRLKSTVDNPVAEYGHSRGWSQFPVPMNHRGTRVGELVVEPRAPEEGFGRRESRLLTDLAGQAAPVAQSARLAEILRQSDERFEREREEDLVRITDDLHDGIGPSVVGIRLQIDAVRKQSHTDDPRIRRQLDRAVEDLNAISSQVRELIRNLRPRALRDGLVPAVRDLAARFEGSLDVCVTAVEIPEQIPQAVELAAYRIIGEALNNTVRHANASTCAIHLSGASELDMTITDDGTGISSSSAAGLGLRSMRRRCESLDGSFAIASSQPGTQIVVRLPLTTS